MWEPVKVLESILRLHVTSVLFPGPPSSVFTYNRDQELSKRVGRVWVRDHIVEVLKGELTHSCIILPYTEFCFQSYYLVLFY